MEETHIGIWDGCKWWQEKHMINMLWPIWCGQLNDRGKTKKFWCHVTELGDIGGFLNGEGGGKYTDLVVHGCVHSQCDGPKWARRRHSLIIIMNSYGAYILRNLSSEAQQNRIIKHNREQRRAKLSIRKTRRNNRNYNDISERKKNTA